MASVPFLSRSWKSKHRGEPPIQWFIIILSPFWKLPFAKHFSVCGLYTQLSVANQLGGTSWLWLWMEDAIQVLAAILALPSAREECSELTAKRGAPRRLYFSILQSVQCRLQCILGVWIFKGQSNLSRSVEMRASLEGNDSDLKQMLENMGLLSRIFCDSAFKHWL